MQPAEANSGLVRLLGSVALAALVGAGAAVAVQGLRGEAPQVREESEPPQALSDLRTELEKEAEARRRLSDEVAGLRGQLDLLTEILSADGSRLAALLDPAAALDGDAPSADPDEAEADPEEASAEVAADQTEDESSDKPAPAAKNGKPWFNIAALQEIGLSSDEIERLRVVWEAYEMDKLYLWDSAARSKSGLMKAHLRRAALDRSLRDEIGEDDYDLLLFASGQPNRVTVEDVLESSPGGQAGLATGDVIFRYDGVRVYQPRDLRHVITATPEGELVLIEAWTPEGELKRVRIPGGPIGIKMVGSVKAPAIP
jgi:hypothetical protein